MSIAEVASSKARGSDTDGSTVVTLGAAIQAGDTIVLDITERGAESATISGISDSVNGSWPAAIVGATDSVGATMRSWFYVFENSGAGTPVITISSGAASIEAVAVALHGTVATPVLDVLGTTYNTAGAAETGPNTAAVSATAAGILVAGINTNVYQGSAPTEGGGGSVGPASTADGRTFIATRAIAGAGSEDFAFTAGSSTRWIVFLASFIEDAGTPPPSITNLNGDDTSENGVAAQTLNGADIDDSAATLDFEQGAVVVSQTVTARTTSSITYTDVESNGATDLAFGTTTARVKNGDDQEDTHTFTRVPEAGTDYEAIVSLNEAAIHLEFNPPLAENDQVQWFVTDGDFDETDFNVNNNGTFEIAEGLDPLDVQARRWRAATQVWSAYGVIVPSVEGDDEPDAFSFTDQFGVATSATITSAAITVSGIDVGASITVSNGTYDINASGSFTSSAGTVSNGDTVRARHTSSADYSTATNTVVTIGGVSDTFTSLTGADPSATGSHSHSASPGRVGGMVRM